MASSIAYKSARALPSSRVLRVRSSLQQSTRRMSTSSITDLHDFGVDHVTKGLARLTPGVIKHGKGSYVTMHDGRELLDFTTGIGVTGLGHCHPKVSKAAADQCMSMVHGQCSIAFHEPYLRLIEKLVPLMPHQSLDSFFLWNSGSEAVEGAIKMARALTKKQNIITMQGAYHGRTFGAMAVTRSKTIYSEGTMPLMPGVFVTAYPYWHQLGLPPSASPAEVSEKALYQLDLILSQQTAASDVAAIIVEPLLGEGGYVPAPPEYLKGLRETCDKHGILLIVDEVQSGFCRTGTNFFIEQSGVKPDILTIAKGIANGFPLSGIVSRRELTDKLKPGSMGGTYAGNAVSCAAGIAVAEVLEEEKILDNVNARSKELFSALDALKSDSTIGSAILDVRGSGLMVSVEFAHPSPASKYDTYARSGVPAGAASRVAKKCIENNLLILTTSVYEVIRFIPPLNISQADLAKGLKIFEQAVRDVVKEC